MKANNTIKLKMLIAFFLFPFLKSIAQDVQVSYFGHAGYTAKFNHQYAPNQNAFNSGGLDVLISSQLTERLSAVGELFTGYRGDGANSVSLSI